MILNECNPFVRSASSNILTRSTKRKRYALNHRLLYFTGGNGAIHIYPASYPAYKDTAILYPAGVVYETTTDSSISFLTLNFDYTQNFTHITHPLQLQREGLGYSTPLEEISFTDFPALNHEIYISNAMPIRNNLQTILDEMANPKADSPAYVSGLLKTVICKILRANDVPSNSTNPKIQGIFSFIHENYASDIDNAIIAAHVNYHPYYANKLFSTYTGMTIHQYLNHYRLMQAANYLSTGIIPIHQICHLVGFQTPEHLTTNFKKKFGVSPKEYRNMHK